MFPYEVGGPGRTAHGYLHGDARELCKALPDGSVDVIYTDPPYGRDTLELYGWLGEMAARVLRPGGFCLVMTGGLYFDVVLAHLSRSLTFHWKYEFQLTGSATGKVHVHGSHKSVIVRQKSILAYSKGKSEARTVTYDVFSGDGGDKRYHRWGQDIVSARYYIDSFSHPGDLVLDPFAGGATTAVAARLIGRRWLLMDSDEAAVRVGRARLMGDDMPLFAGLPTQERMAL